MKPDDFELELQRQQPKRLPPAWRAEILQAAAEAQRGSASMMVPASTRRWWQEWLWPCPQAWAGLAAVWLAILLMNFAGRVPRSPETEFGPAPDARQSLVLLREQQRLLIQLFDRPSSPLRVEPPKTPVPRAQSRVDLTFRNVI